MRLLTIMLASIAPLGVLALTAGHAASADEKASVSCERMMRDHMNMMGSGHSGMMGKERMGMMGKDPMHMGDHEMPMECMDMMKKDSTSGAMGGNAKEARTEHRGTGVVQGVDRDAGTVTLQHEPIESLGWPAMTMPFSVQEGSILEQVKPGQRVEFAFSKHGHRYSITSMK